MLDKDAQLVTTINTHKDLYSYNRLPFGIAFASAIFQRAIETILQGISHFCVYLDDILITGANTDDYLQALETKLVQASKSEIVGRR